MRRKTRPAVRSILIADAREINGKTAGQIQELVALKYGSDYEQKQVADALDRLAEDGAVARKGRVWVVSAEFLH